MELSERAVDLLNNNEIARKIISKLLVSQHYRYTYIEGKDAKVGTGGALRFEDHSDKVVHSIAKELCDERILDCHVGVTLPVYYLRGERPAPGVAAPRNEELRMALTQYKVTCT
ncbi:MAG: hypothetical protein PVJ86_10845 [Phycisphaerales bacterium]|jgi:hypothetical protein